MGDVLFWPALALIACVAAVVFISVVRLRKLRHTIDVFCQVVIGQCGVSFPSEKAVGFSPVRNWPVIARVLLFHCIRA